MANLGNADNLTGHHFAQSNLYAFGRQAWNWKLDSDDIAEDWVRMTWSTDDAVVDTIVRMMMGSWEAIASYQTPLGVGHQFNSDTHYGPNPAQWFTQDDWSPVYYNKADSAGLGFNRTSSGSNFISQYFPALAARYENIETTPENLLMWFHHVPWNRQMSSGRPFWDELVYRYQMGVQYVTWMRETWDSLAAAIGARRFAEVKAKLAIHEADAANWRNTSVNYFREFSDREIPVDDGPLSAKIVVNGKQIGGFNLSATSYAIPIAAGASPTITNVIPTDPAATYQIVSQASSVPGQAVVKVTKNDFFGPIVKNYVFNMVTDTTLKSLRVNSKQLAVVQAGHTHIQRSPAQRRPLHRDGRRRRERSRRHRRHRTGDQRHRPGPGHSDQRRRVIGVHRQSRRRHQRQRSVRLHGSRVAMAVAATGQQPLAPCGRFTRHHLTER